MKAFALGHTNETKTKLQHNYHKTSIFNPDSTGLSCDNSKLT